MNTLETTICGKRLENFLGTASADYTRVLWREGNELVDYDIFSGLVNQGLLGFTTTKTLTAEKREPEWEFAWTREFE